MKKIVAGMMNALLRLTTSLKAEVRSTRTHSSVRSTVLLSGSFPTDLALYGMPCIQSSVYASAYTTAYLGTKKNPPARRRGASWGGFECAAFRPGPLGWGGGSLRAAPRRAHYKSYDRAGGH